jgi:hypothetical protein
MDNPFDDFDSAKDCFIKLRIGHGQELVEEDNFRLMYEVLGKLHKLYEEFHAQYFPQFLSLLHFSNTVD